MRRALWLVLLLSACASDQVPLAYHLEPGLRLEHRLNLDAEITRTLEGQIRDQEVHATFRATQQIRSSRPDGGALAAMSLSPEALEVDGRPVDAGPGQEFVVVLGRDGRVVGIREAVGDPSEALGPVGIERLLPRLRPVLPGEPVSAGETWSSSTTFADESGTFSLTSESRLAQLGLARGREAALVRTTYRSPVNREESFANADVDMQGTDLGAQEAWFALDGFLVRSSSDSVGTYRVTFRPPGGEVGLAPVQGSLVVRLHTDLELVSITPG